MLFVLNKVILFFLSDNSYTWRISSFMLFLLALIHGALFHSEFIDFFFSSLLWALIFIWTFSVEVFWGLSWSGFLHGRISITFASVRHKWTLSVLYQLKLNYWLEVFCFCLCVFHDMREGVFRTQTERAARLWLWIFKSNPFSFPILIKVQCSNFKMDNFVSFFFLTFIFF